jgi:hypothetical protein
LAKQTFQISSYFPFPNHYNGLIANLLLFNVDEDADLIEKKRIRCIFDEAARSRLD